MKIETKTAKSLMARANVVAVGWGFKKVGGERTDAESIVCSVIRKVPKEDLPVNDLIPPMMDGVQTDVIETGVIKALELDSGGGGISIKRIGKVRPAPGGVSIGHYKITAGTLGCLVIDSDDDLCILSNNHVLANSNDALIGDYIYQPGPHDLGNSGDLIATLKNYVPISFQGDGDGSECPIARFVAWLANIPARLLGRKSRLVATAPSNNYVDAAIARPLSDDLVTPEILEVGRVDGTVEGTLGMAVKKSGRTTGLTTGQIEQTDVMVSVQYGAGKVALFQDQLMTGPMCEGGDSGSAVLDMNNNLTGLLFAGSDTVMICSRIQWVFDLLGLDYV